MSDQPEKKPGEEPGGVMIGARSMLRPKVDGKRIWNRRLRLWQWALLFAGIYFLVRGIRAVLGA